MVLNNLRINSFKTIIVRKFINGPFKPFVMSKDRKSLNKELMRQRKKNRASSAKYAPSKITLQILGNGGRGESRAVLFATDHTNYLFNCGEGTQRLAHEYRIRLTKLEHIFITKPDWNNMGGLPGLTLTIQDAGVPTIQLHGPKGTKALFEAAQKFVILEGLQVEEADTSANFEDPTMKVNYIPLVNPKIKEDISGDDSNLATDDTNYYPYQFQSNGKRKRPVSPKNFSSDTVTQKNLIMAYACKIHPRVGTLDISKCVDFGVPAGPELGRLKAGEDITLPDGRIVRSQDVVSPSEAGPLIIVIECPNEDWLEVVESNSNFLKYQVDSAACEEDIPNYIVHFTPHNIFNHPKYQAWIEQFGKSCKHLVINENNLDPSSEAMYKMQHQLHLLHNTIFPLPADKKLINHCSSSVENHNEISSSIQNSNKDLEIYNCHTLQTFHLRPPTGLNTHCRVNINPKQYIQDVFDVNNFLDDLAELQTLINNESKNNYIEYPKLVMLGTGSSIPNKYRNTSGILLQITNDTSVILDCGEGTVGQIIKLFGHKADDILRSIKGIYVSHLHADHHLGLLGILKARCKVTEDPIILLAPERIQSWLQFYDDKFESIKELYTLIPNRDIVSQQKVLPSEKAKMLLDTLKLANITTTYVKHCPYAYGVALKLLDGQTIVYSGDTMPSDNLLRIGDQCHLLIHEATMEDGLEQEAKAKFHSTISQAIAVGNMLRAKFTLLTHFSQRYSKIPILPLKEPGQTNAEAYKRIGIAYDFMSISLSQLHLLPYFYDALSRMFQEFRDSLDMKAYKREVRRDLEMKAEAMSKQTS